MYSNKINVLIVDDSKIFQRVMQSDLEKDGRFHVQGVANHPLEAFQLIKQQQPDVILLDVEMPHMNGFEFLVKLKQTQMIPTILFTSQNDTGMKLSLRAMEVGALHIYHKPQTAADFKIVFQELKEQLVDIAKVNLKRSVPYKQKIEIIPQEAENIETSNESLRDFDSNAVILIGSSTGGVQALSTILPKFPKNSPPILIVQHMPEGFTSGFAKRMDKSCAMHVCEAKSGDMVEAGTIYIAPGGDKHMEVILKGNRLAICLRANEKVNGHRPSVDVLFNSFSEIRKFRPIVTVLTGMGSDGADGMKLLSKYTNDLIIQSESTCVVYGMPMVAKELSPQAKSIDLEDIPGLIVKMASR